MLESELLLLPSLLDEELLPAELLPPPEVPPPPLDEPPPPLLDSGVASVLASDEIDSLLDGATVSELLSIELDGVCVECSEGGSLEPGGPLLLRLDDPLDGGCWVVAHTGI